VAEGLARVRVHPVVADAGLLGLQVVVRKAGLADVAEAELRRRVLDLFHVLFRVGSCHLVLFLPAATGATHRIESG
jgi:hypothetical protein